jgi:hypothetical protein
MCCGAQEFLLSPLQLGVPYSRPRYYALARQRTPSGAFAFPVASLPDSQPFCCPATSLLPLSHPNLAQSGSSNGSGSRERQSFAEESCTSAAMPQSDPQNSRAEVSGALLPISAFLVDSPSPGDGVSSQSANSNGGVSEEDELGQAEGTVSGSGEGREEFFWVPDNVIEQWGEVLDIVVPSSQRCNCFTKTYTRYTKVVTITYCQYSHSGLPARPPPKHVTLTAQRAKLNRQSSSHVEQSNVHLQACQEFLCNLAVMSSILVWVQGSGSQLATQSLDLVQLRPGLHPGDLTLRPDEDALQLARRRMVQPDQQPSQDSSSPLNAGQNISSGEPCDTLKKSASLLLWKTVCGCMQ